MHRAQIDFFEVVDPETEKNLGPNQRGELRLKTDFQLNGYYNKDSSSVWDDDGWLKTGDIVYYDEEQCFYVVDRIKEMLKYKSWHVAPAKLEAIVCTHPDVVNATVIGIPHPEDGDHPMALVILRDGATVNPETLQKFVDEKVDDRQKLRGGVKIVKEFPKTPTGKVKRVELRNKAVAGLL